MQWDLTYEEREAVRDELTNKVCEVCGCPVRLVEDADGWRVECENIDNHEEEF